VTPARLVLPLLAALALGCTKPSGPTDPPDDGEEAVPADPIEHAQQLLQAGKPAEAQAVLDDALAKTPSDPELLFSKGVAQRAQGDTAGATASWEKALSIKPELVAARHGLAALKVEAGDNEGAVKAYTEILQIDPDFADGHYNLGLALLALGRKDEARGALENAHRLRPDDPDVAVELGRLYALDGKLKEAAELVAPAAEKAKGDAGIQSTYAWMLEKLNRFDEAAVHFEAALAVEPDDDDTRLGLARTYLRIPGKEKQAAAELEALAGRRPNDAAVWLAWGSALGKLGDTEGALAKLDKAIALEPKMLTAHVQKLGTLVLANRCKDAKAVEKQIKKLELTDHARRAVTNTMKPCR
jgi:tetratricopeptide (TPR) repeat protein